MSTSSPEIKKVTTLIVGAGAAGMMAAVAAGLHGAKDVVLLDGSPRPGLKLTMCGGGRCNLTNSQLQWDGFSGESQSAIKKVIRQFPPERVVQFFESAGLKLKIEEPWHKYFPANDSAHAVVKLFHRKLEELHMPIVYPRKVNNFYPDAGGWQVVTEQAIYWAQQLVLAAGGLSYPQTGSDGSIWNILRNLGVSLEEPYPALTPLFTSDTDFQSLTGIALPCRVKVKQAGKTIFEDGNPVLFTHIGLSGPAILNCSQWFTKKTAPDQLTLTISFLPEYRPDQFEQELIAAVAQTPNLKLVKYLDTYFPGRVAQVLAERSGVAEKQLRELTKTERRTVVEQIFQFQPSITGNGGYTMAEATGGGIPFAELELATMRMKKYDHLYAAGEIVNVHGSIGGYNLQWAWSSGYVCGKAIANRE